LPEADFGITAMKSTTRTFLCGATFSAVNAMTSSAVMLAPSWRTTKACGTSPSAWSGAPTTATSSTAG
jgi:hypothetical protein